MWWGKVTRVVDFLLAFLKVPLTGTFLEAAGNKVSDFGAEEIREQTEAGTTANLLVPRCDLSPTLHPVQTGALCELTTAEVEGEAAGETGVGRLGTDQAGDSDTGCGNNIRGSMTNP